MQHRLFSLGVAIVALSMSFAGHGQAAHGQSTLDADKMKRHDMFTARAKAEAVGPATNLVRFCDVPPPGTGNPMVTVAPFEPARAFDNLYYVGLNWVSAWAIKTSDGIILIDALNNAKDAEETIIPNMRKVGLDPAQIKYLVITHAHADHFGGAQYLREHFNPRIVASDADWKIMEAITPKPGDVMPPKRDMTIVDGQKITLGDTSISLYITPGHTPGTISLILPVKDQGKPHVAALWGGTAFNFKQVHENYRAYIDSADRFSVVARRAGADVILSNHGNIDGSFTKLPAMKTRKPGQPNSLVVGADQVRSFLAVAGDCARARDAAL